MATARIEATSSFPLMAALDASGVVGAWDWDHVRNVAVYDRGAAGLLAGDAALAGCPLDCDAAMPCVHPDDFGALVEETIRATRVGGLFLSEYRVVLGDGRVRWLLSRGRTYLGETGLPLNSRGILIDITEGREDGDSYVTRPTAGVDHPLEAAADHLTTVRETLTGIGTFRLRAALDVALMEIGKMVATSIRLDRTKRH
ncbi:PAS domain-containing protein [Methylobacterium haplocladii]|uniref:PAC domain-containing protein n=1 Tax=Methylobacterium haplocladii TaxID=1176176 RepID=A0A512IKE2_9HYPH|nr:PAS domain-containing protein [Methylobacterium haplocladii]GEO98108.1 hypothetical protein MHA02_04960 [Methylobacterium haplocladii]GLS59041.1 hypothetical protein GCM10007887_17070 [Methylobacterium haplocladii]